MSENLINQFIINQQEINRQMASGLADIKRGQTDMSERLFGGPNQPGAFSYIKANADKDAASLEKVTARVGRLEGFKRDLKIWVGASVSIVSTEATVLAFWFVNIAKHVHIP
jgi:hypothetical protein